MESEKETVVVESEKSNKKNLPNFFQSINLKHVKLGYHYLVSNAMYLLFIPILALIFAHLSTLTHQDLSTLWNQLRFNILTVITCTAFLVVIITVYVMSLPRNVYLLDFSCFKPDPVHKVTKQRYMQLCKESGIFTEETLGFKKRILEKSGFGDMTYGPHGLMHIPINMSLPEARKETEMVMYGAIDQLLGKTGVKPREIGILVVNSSLFNPVPSLSAMIVNRYKLRGNILSYNLGGMGCSAGLISVDLAKDLLQGTPNSYALVVSTENITRNWYTGNERPMLVTNCLFRVGAAAILLTNRSSDRRRSKYKLIHTVRTNKGADDKCYNCVIQQEDQNQVVGVSLSKDLMAVAGEALKANITTLGPLVLPISEQLLFLATLIGKKLLKMKIKPYIPDFKLAFEHFCIHAGGRGVLDELEKHLELSPWHMEPSRMTLYRYGNTSSSSLWYELAYSEAKGRIKKGDRVWQIGFGSGFKCNSAVWRAIRSINPAEEKNPWMDEIDDFPAHIPKVSPIDFTP
ncbi:3-ketoacyl-CoA synthase 11-like [Euphorbia lathyris]|uniref:3-ketoacyl-CoA synthase 11-like n=1 Tax=Euphorbia lathyris TaxID=212925 RepID=UPI00331433D1